MTNSTNEIVRTTLAVLVFSGLIVASLWVLRPFIPALIWAAMLVVATWPLMLSIEKKLWGRRSLATVTMTALILLVLVLPVVFAFGAIVNNSGQILNWLKSLGNLATPEPPHWLRELPFLGRKLAQWWQEIGALAPKELRSRLLPHTGAVLKWVLEQVGNIGSLFLHFLLTLIIATVLYLKGEAATAGISKFARFIAGTRGEESVRLAAQAIRAVAVGVVVTAMVQAAFAWIGLVATRIPYAWLLTAISFVLCLVQLGPAPVLLSVVFWLAWNGKPWFAAALFVWALLAQVIDNVIRPVLIKRAGNISLLLIIPGVLGGLIAFGFIGIFIGPVVLAVAHTLFASWVETQ